MRERGKGLLTDYLAERTSLLELILVAVFIAFGINLIANNLLGDALPYRNIYVGLGICLGALLYLFIRILARRTQIRQYEGFVIYDKRKNKIINVPRYDLANELVNYLESAFSENKALKIIWGQEPLIKNLESDNEPLSSQLIREAIEYFVLDNLCVHLTDYFAKGKFRSEKLETFAREQIPSGLLNNRFLELFSRPMKDRSAFVKEALSADSNRNGETITTWGKRGEYYNKFELRLPMGSKLVRLSNNAFKVVTKKLDLTISIKFEGANTLLPWKYGDYYLGINQFSSNIQVYEIEATATILFKLGILFSARGKDYYKWIDSFLDELDARMSESTYFKSIGWDSAITVIECLSKSAKTNKKKKDADSDK